MLPHPQCVFGLAELHSLAAQQNASMMRAELDGMKNITVCDAVVTIRSAANAAAEAQMDVLADELLAK